MPCAKTACRMTGLAAVVLAFLLRPSFLRAQGTVEGYPNLSPAAARESIAKRSGDPGFVLLDVRTPKEFAEGRIEGAVLVDFLSPSFRDEMAKFDRGKTYLVYCRTGHRTVGALKIMRELGFPDVFVIAGGITKWKEAGFPTAR
ncbi:MAG: rhodanese-like domain-containing protein [Actinomycetota bacterium]